MASFIKLWCSIRHETWWKELKANGRGGLCEMLLMVKEQRDNGHLIVPSVSNLAAELAMNRRTLGKLVVFLHTVGAVTPVPNDHGYYHLYFPKYMKWQKMNPKEAVQNAQAPPSQIPDRPDQTRPDQTNSAASSKELALDDKKIKKTDTIPYQQIVDDLNKATDRNGNECFRNTETVRRSIRARFGEGYNFEDFQHVHKTMAGEWMYTDMQKYLNPDTLYRPSKFQKYVTKNRSPV